MPEDQKKTYFVTFQLEDDIVVAHGISTSPPTADYKIPTDKPQVIESDPVNSEKPSFNSIIMDFVSVMDSYLKFITFTLNITPQLSASIARDRMERFTSQRGVQRNDLSNEHLKVFELDVTTFSEFCWHKYEIDSIMTGARQIPRVMIIGLISAYDAYLGQLLQVAHANATNISLIDNKEIKFSDLRKYSSIEDARKDLIDKEVDTVMRRSHQDQMAYIEKQFGLSSLPYQEKMWPKFVELCERRNLLTHTSGVVSAQYINVCNEYKCLPASVRIGQTLNVNSGYFRDSIGTVYEMGVRVGYALWRKCVENERSAANSMYNEICYNLIRSRQCHIAENLLKFAVEHLKRYDNKEDGCVQFRHMMVVNHANAVKLQSSSRKEEVNRILSSVDWSTSNSTFLACVAAVRDDIDKLIGIMTTVGNRPRSSENGGAGPSADSYRTWPVFSSARKDMRFISAFERIFDEPLVTGKAISDTVDLGESTKTEDVS